MMGTGGGTVRSLVTAGLRPFEVVIVVVELAVMAVMLRRLVVEIGLRSYDPSRHRLYVRQEGRGPAVLLLHGLAASWRYWRRGFSDLASQHTLYLPDLLGFGRSPKPRGDYSLSMHANAVSQLLTTVSEPVTLVGHSMGALVALQLYARYPERIRHVVLIGLPFFPARELAERSFSRLSYMNRLAITRSWLAPALCYMKDLWALPPFAALARVPVDLYRDYWKHTWTSVSQSLFNTILSVDVPALLQTVDRTRITLIHGKSDSTAPIEHVRGLVERFPNLTLRELNGGHHLYLLYPRLVNRIVASLG